MIVETVIVIGAISVCTLLVCLPVQERFVDSSSKRAIDVSDKYTLPVEHDPKVEQDECAICCEPLKGDRRVIQCIACKNIVHQNCLVEHILYSEMNNRKLKCIMGCE
jgi:hypothetical protein